MRKSATILVPALIVASVVIARPAFAQYSCGQLAPGADIPSGQSLSSCSGNATLAMQGDGNLVLYNNGSPLWATNTGSGNDAIMQGDGNFVLYDGAMNPLFDTGTYGQPGNWLAMQDDCNLVVYDSGGAPVWASNTAGCAGAGGGGGGGGGPASIGCYADSDTRDLPYLAYDDGSNSAESCIASCADAGYAYAGTQYSSQCFCGTSYGSYGTSGNCNMACSGNGNETCGGGWANTVYATGFTPPPPPPPPPAPCTWLQSTARLTNASRGDVLASNGGPTSVTAGVLGSLGYSYSHVAMVQTDTGQFIAEQSPHMTQDDVHPHIQNSIFCPSYQPIDPNWLRAMTPGTTTFRALTPTDASLRSLVVYGASASACPYDVNFTYYKMSSFSVRQYSGTCTDFLIDQCGFINPPASGPSFDPGTVQNTADQLWWAVYDQFAAAESSADWGLGSLCDVSGDSAAAADQVVNEMAFGNGWVSTQNLVYQAYPGLGGTGAPPVIQGGGAIAPDQLALQTGKSVAVAGFDAGGWYCVPNSELP